MFFENSLRWLLISFAIINTSKGSPPVASLGEIPGISDTVPPTKYDTKLNDQTETVKKLYEPQKGRLRREANFEEKKESDVNMSDVMAEDNFEKRMKEAKSSAIGYTGQKNGIGWLPWHNGMGPVRRSFFVPRLGKRLDEDLSSSMHDESSDDYFGETEVTPAEVEYFQNALAGDVDTNKFDDLKDLFSDNYDDIDDENDDSLYINDDISSPVERDIRAYSFVPRLGKRTYAFAPRLGKRTYTFAPRLGKRTYAFSPRLGKRTYSFAPRLGKRTYAFSPRLGKRTYSFSPRLGKRAYSFSPRLGKKAYSLSGRLGKKSYSFAPRLGK